MLLKIIKSYERTHLCWDSRSFDLLMNARRRTNRKQIDFQYNFHDAGVKWSTLEFTINNDLWLQNSSTFAVCSVSFRFVVRGSFYCPTRNLDLYFALISFLILPLDKIFSSHFTTSSMEPQETWTFWRTVKGSITINDKHWASLENWPNQ